MQGLVQSGFSAEHTTSLPRGSVASRLAHIVHRKLTLCTLLDTSSSPRLALITAIRLCRIPLACAQNNRQPCPVHPDASKFHSPSFTSFSALIVPCSACLWFRRNLGSVPLSEGYRCVLGFLILCVHVPSASLLLEQSNSVSSLSLPQSGMGCLPGCRREDIVPVLVRLLRLVVLGRVLGFCVVSVLLCKYIGTNIHTGHCDGCGCGICLVESCGRCRRRER